MSARHRISTMLALSGWAVGGLVGIVFLLSVLGLGGYFGSADAGIVALVGIVLGGGVGVVGGGIVQFAVRAAMAPALPAPPVAPLAIPAPERPIPLREGGLWAAHHARCAESVRRFHALVAALAPGPARDWLADLGAKMDTELDEALRLARYGEALAPGGDGHEESETAQRISARLEEAASAFAATLDRAGGIALDISAASDFEAIRAQLELLEAQAPHLRGGQEA
ncbi:hypothetical protein [Amycolatopsis sp. CA-230715]|uniref:hypothetical protein n=1 Tax=Amycolatopsis sp. CA-230715 TaxID=2745196 RepID=UPI001C020700|nr:hypothetical protein [Amycolatopsis sp. CA-230715]QWF84651.1 hypothetical protein HUW46_08102 [Amycolatopsis sp. CA-230715]